MPDFLISLIAVVVILGFMILIHEFGHYAVAKRLGVRVEVFSIGFGKRLLGFRKGDTDYRISAIPLGGYVKMSGENPMDDRTDDPGEFLNHSRWHRFLIAIAGPAMNILLAIFLLTSVYMVHYEYPVFMDKLAVIDGVKANSAAALAGLQPGDRIVKIDGITNPTWEQVQPRVMIQPASRRDHPARRQGSRENHHAQASHFLRSRLRWLVSRGTGDCWPARR
jgi:regulator of sigma E protease